MKLTSLQVGPIGTNCYIVENEKTHHAVVIDPGDEGDMIVDTIREKGLTVDAIFLTHGHMDHMNGLKEVREYTKAKVYIHPMDSDRLTNCRSLFFPIAPKNFGAADQLYNDGDKIEAAGYTFEILATPGHTPGGVCIKVGDTVFCGDTIFAESIGRTDLPGGSYEEILRSIKEKIMPLDDDTKLYPGHGPSTSVGWERRRNPFIQ